MVEGTIERRLGCVVDVLIFPPVGWPQQANELDPDPAYTFRTRAMIDPGSNKTTIDLAIADSLRLPRGRPATLVGIGGPRFMSATQAKDAPTALARIEAVGVSHQTSVYAAAIPGLIEALEIGAILGRDFLRDYVFVFNGPAATFRLRRP
jgi:hypothetical protein